MNNPLTPVEAITSEIDRLNNEPLRGLNHLRQIKILIAALELAKEVNAYRATLQPEVLMKLHELLEALK